jgi:hypothetical protein
MKMLRGLAAVLCDIESPGLALTTILLLVVGTPVWDGLTAGWPASRLVALGAGALVAASLWRMRSDASVLWPVAAGALAGVAALASPTGLSLAIGAAALGLARTEIPWRRRLAHAALTLLSGGAVVALGDFVPGAGEVAVGDLGNPLSSAGVMALTESLFRSPDGLLYCSPLLWVAGLGGVLMLRRERRIGLAFAATGLSVLLIAAALRKSAVTFDALLPLAALGLGRALAVATAVARRRPLVPLAAGAAALVLWNFLLMEQYRRGLVPRDDTVSFADVTAGNARLASEAVGAPPAWPATWYVAARERLPLDGVDALIGRRLFAGPDGQAAMISLADPTRDVDLLLDGWGSPRPRGGHICRTVLGDAAVAVPLTAAEDLDVGLVLAGQGSLRLAVQGRVVAELPAAADFTEPHVRVAAAYWRAPFSRLLLSAQPGSGVCVERIVLARRERHER